MADEKEKLERAQKVYDTICSAMDAFNWHYTKEEEKLRIRCTIKGEDIPMDFVLIADADRQLIRLISFLPFEIPEDKRLDAAIAVSIVNNRLVDGSFDYDVKTGDIMFRMTNSFIESDISQELLSFMTMIALHTIDEYNDKFLMLGKGILKPEDFMKN